MQGLMLSDKHVKPFLHDKVVIQQINTHPSSTTN
jgi:hypothetical protein